LGPEAVRRFDTDPHVTPFLKALDRLRREATRQGEFPEHVATIVAMIDQYAESAIGDRHYFAIRRMSWRPASLRYDDRLTSIAQGPGDQSFLSSEVDLDFNFGMRIRYGLSR
jgi:hypothetical protein